MTAPSIVQVYPSDEATGVILADSLYVIFDREVDESSVKILLEGPEGTSWWSGPDLVRWDNPSRDEDDDILDSPGYDGVVPGSISFQKVDSEGTVLSGALDYSGGGSAWRTKVIFAPENPLAASTDYTIYVFGDEDDGDNIDSGVSSRTIFDPQKGSNIGDGDVYTYGGYTGTSNDIYYIEVKETGDAGDGIKFEWWRTSAPTHRELHSKLQYQLLDKGVQVRFYGDFVVGDTFSIVVRPADRMVSTYRWSFTTGAGSFSELPSTVASDPSVPVSSTSVPTSTDTASSFRVDEWTPAMRATNQTTLGVTQIVANFTADIDEDTIDSNSVQMWTEPVGGWDDGTITYTGSMSPTLTVDGSQLTLSFTNVTGDQSLYDNNMVFVKLSEDIADTDGNTLGADVDYYFTTTYTPFYSSERRIRLELGSILKNVPDDTINLAIWEASVEADALTFGSLNFSTADEFSFFRWARRQFVTCVAELILLSALTSQGSGADGKSKKLADLNVSYNGGGPVDDLMDKAISCMAKWRAVLTSGGEVGPGTSLKPLMAIKGNYDPDRPNIGRDYEPTSTYGQNIEDSIPAANTRSKRSTRRRWRRDYSFTRWSSNGRWKS